MRAQRYRRRGLTGWIGALVFGLSVWYLARNFQWVEVWGMVRRANWPMFFGGGSSSIVGYWFLRALRWRSLLRSLKIRLSVREVYLPTAVSLSLAIVTPVQSGEVLKVELLKNREVLKRSAGYSTFLVERVMDLLVVFLFGAIALGSALARFSSSGLLLLAGILAVGLLLGVYGWKRGLFPGFVYEFLVNLRECFQNTRVLMGVLSLTVLSWGVVALGWQVTLASLAINLRFVDALGLMSVTTLVNVLSFIPGAVGISEVSITEALGLLGYNILVSQAGAIMLRFYSLLILILGLMHWVYWQVLHRARQE